MLGLARSPASFPARPDVSGPPLWRVLAFLGFWVRAAPHDTPRIGRGGRSACTTESRRWKRGNRRDRHHSRPDIAPSPRGDRRRPRLFPDHSVDRPSAGDRLEAWAAATAAESTGHVGPFSPTGYQLALRFEMSSMVVEVAVQAKLDEQVAFEWWDGAGPSGRFACVSVWCSGAATGAWSWRSMARPVNRASGG
jgi:hypothetical protein